MRISFSASPVLNRFSPCSPLFPALSFFFKIFFFLRKQKCKNELRKVAFCYLQKGKGAKRKGSHDAPAEVSWVWSKLFEMIWLNWKWDSVRRGFLRVLSRFFGLDFSNLHIHKIVSVSVRKGTTLPFRDTRNVNELNRSCPNMTNTRRIVWFICVTSIFTVSLFD